MNRLKFIRGKPFLFKILLLSFVLSLSIPIFAFAAPNSNEETLINGHDFIITHSPDPNANFVFLTVFTEPLVGVFYQTDTASRVKWSVSQSYTLYSSSDGGATFGSNNSYTDSGNNDGTVLTDSSVDIYDLASGGSVVFAKNYFVTDSTAPEDVSNLSGDVSNSDITLNWSASTSPDIASYDVFKDSVLVGNTALTTFTYVGLEPLTPYSFVVKSVDSSDNRSAGVTYSFVSGGVPVFDYTSAEIVASATTWANNFQALLLVVVGVGVGFACVRFVKSLFF